MIKTVLTFGEVSYLTEKQKQLDKFIMDNKHIEYIDWLNHYDELHDIALRVEIGEFVNEARDIWKYWKGEAVNRERLLDEAIDVIHFIFLQLNKVDATIDEKTKNINYWIKSANEFIGFELTATHLHLLLTEDYTYYYILAFILVILDRYGFTTANIIDQYNEKNKKNFDRITNGY